MRQMKEISTMELKAIGYDLIQESAFIQRRLTVIQSDIQLIEKELIERAQTPPPSVPSSNTP